MSTYCNRCGVNLELSGMRHDSKCPTVAAAPVHESPVEPEPEALLPCPFCGKPTYDEPMREHGEFFVMCSWCEARIGGSCKSIAEAEAEWNCRAPHPDRAALVAETREWLAANNWGEFLSECKGPFAPEALAFDLLRRCLAVLEGEKS